MEVEKQKAYWLEMAEYDLDTARAMLESLRYLYVGFMCHQAIEKVLKAYFVSAMGTTPPFTHNLTLLAQKSSLYEELSEGQMDFIDYLEPLNIEARYPTDKNRLMQELTDKKCGTLLKETEEMQLWIKQRL